MNELKQNNFSRAGSYWSVDEENQLLEECRIDLPINEISILHQRSVSSIKSRISLLSKNFLWMKMLYLKKFKNGYFIKSIKSIKTNIIDITHQH